MKLILTLTTIFSIINIISSSSIIPKKNHDLKNYFAIELSSKDELKTITENFPNWSFEHEARGNPNHFVFSINKSHGDVFDLNNDDEIKPHLQKREALEFKSLVENHGIKSIHRLPLKKLIRRAPVPISGSDRIPVTDKNEEFKKPTDSSLEPIIAAQEKYKIDDPEFQKQWHLINPNYPGHDVNVTGVWDQNITGNGVVAAIVDDGLDLDSKDLKDNFCAKGSWDFNNNDPLPRPRLNDDYHGTRCAGEIAAVKNDVCGIGVAYNSKVSGIRILSAEITNEDEAAALVYGLDVNDIYSCSWGPHDDGKAMQAPNTLVKNALVRGVHEGRKGKGAIYVFASGNGGLHGDNCNYDGYTNSIYSITVGAIDHKGLHPPYAEACSAVLVVTYSSGSGEHIHTTDIEKRCSDTHGGTSAAAPLAAGVYTLVLEANPNLTWRDVQYLTIHSSNIINENDGDWQDAALSKYSHKYGYGSLDAFKVVELAKNWTNVNEQVNKTTQVYEANKPVEFNKIADHDFHIEKQDLSNFKNLEHVILTLNMDTSIRGQVSVDLISPSNVVSNLGVYRRLDQSNEGFQNWNFMSVAHWGDENFQGNWKVKVRNHGQENKVFLKNFKLTFFGQKRDEVDETSSSSLPSSSSQVQQQTSSSIVISSSSSSISSSKSSDSIQPSSTSYSHSIEIPKPTPTESKSNDSEGKYKQSQSHYAEYFLVLIVIGFIIIMVYFKKFASKISRRREQYEFDIINPEDTESDSEFELDNRLSSSDLENELSQSFNEDDLNSNSNQNKNKKDSFEIDSDDDDDQNKNKNKKDVDDESRV
ncbi:Kexin [Wickerhamomyces ciferrii]|uniref:Kexin n=1 Tax=Wickerhamomyces ciferrii (strain ATCC 14091 / BCRC 22168 / CBS 111 / JCM 3599 / NBRC 0793 / NRRL Y-1031 F-60-10) TaxID=1206466 RepID=K0KH55_WICCF|nr:Kexin [Wickerhamomyces ciferrii]CCH44545.1 Kexin [Wickerhamomyces ciferrii]